jgi:polar amino acid transport system substrate-binding protein
MAVNRINRLRRFGIWGVLAAALGVGLFFLLRRPADDGALTWAADEEGGAPYVFQDPNHPGENLGFEAELATELQNEVGRPIRFQHADFSSLIPGLRRGDYSFAMNGLEILPDRQREVRFSRPYYVYKLQLAVRNGEDRFSSLEELKDLSDVSVGTLGGSAAERVLQKRGIKYRPYSGQTGLYKDLDRGELDAVYLDLPIHSYYLPLYPTLRLTGRPGEKGYYAIAFRKDDMALAARFDAALEQLIKEDRLRPIYEKWKLWNDDQKELADPALPPGDLDPGRDWTFDKYFWLLLQGAGFTVMISVLGMAVAVALGLPIALARLYGPAPLRWLAVAYVEFFRGIPVLLLLYFIYFGLPDLANEYGLGAWFHLSPLTAAVVGFGLNYAAYEAEIYRAGVGAVGRGQWEAAAVLGMSRPLTFRRIILPQALRIILPPMTSDFVALFKDTSVVSIIGVVELSKQYQMASQSSLKYVEIGLVTAALYLVMSVPLGYLSRWLEKRWSKAP